MNLAQRQILLPLVAAMLTTATPASAQCGKCGDGGGDDRPPGYVAKTDLRAGSSVELPGGGAVRADVVVREELPDGGVTQRVGAAQVTLTFRSATSRRITGLQLVQNLTATDEFVAADLTSAAGGVALTGDGTLVRQAPVLRDVLPIRVGTASYAVKLQVDGGTWISIPVRPARTNFTAIAPLASGSNGPGSGGVAVLSLVGMRGSDGTLQSAGITIEAIFTGAVSNFNPAVTLGIYLSPTATAPLVGAVVNQTAQNRVRLHREIETDSELAVLEQFLRTPDSFYVRVTPQGLTTFAGRIEKVEPLQIRIVGFPMIDGSRGVADALASVYVTRTSYGSVSGAFVSLEWLARNFPGTGLDDSFAGIRPFDRTGSPIVEDNGSISVYDFDEASNDLRIRASEVGFNQRMILKYDSKILKALLASPDPDFAGALFTKGTPNGIVAFDTLLIANSSAVFVSRIEPSTTTPGSIVAVYGGGFDDGSRLLVGGVEAEILAGLTPQQFQARISRESGPVYLEAPAFVVSGSGRASNNLLIDIDAAQPYIFTDNGTPRVSGSAGINGVVTAGQDATINLTGLTDNGLNAASVRPDISVVVRFGSATEMVVTPIQNVSKRGYWTITFPVPANLAKGQNVLTVVAKIQGRTGTIYEFPSNAVTVEVR